MVRKILIIGAVIIVLLIFAVGPAQAGSDVGGFFTSLITFLTSLHHNVSTSG